MIGQMLDEPGLLSPQFDGRRMELAHRRRTPVPTAKATTTSTGRCGWARVKRAKRPWDADRFFRFRKYWDYSGGIATDLFYHVVAPLNICWGEPQFPHQGDGDAAASTSSRRATASAKCRTPST